MPAIQARPDKLEMAKRIWPRPWLCSYSQ